MMMPSENAKPRNYALVFWAAGAFVFIRSFPILSPILLSFLLIVLISLAINPVVVRWRRLGGGRTLATMALVCLFFTIAGLTAWAFYHPFKKSTAKFVDRLPDYWERIQRPIARLEHRAVLSEEKIKREVSREAAGANLNGPAPEPGVSAPRPDSRTPFGQMMGTITSSFTTLAYNAASLMLVLVTVFVGVVFTLLNPRPVLATIFGTVPERHHERAVRIAQRIAVFVPRWAVATLLGMAVIGVLVFLAMWPIFGFQDALVLGLISTVFEAVPYVGPIFSGVPALLLAVGEGGLTPLWVIIAYVAIQALEHNVISPIIVAGRLNLHPVAVIFSVLLSVAAFGILGVLVAVPLAGIAGILHDEIYRRRFLPHVTDLDLEQMARRALEDQAVPRHLPISSSSTDFPN
jgi:predicted PurR-regulated permease PerM